MITRCMIVDDEPLAVEVITAYLDRFEQAEITAVCHDAVAAIDTLQKEKIDLLFLDIQMPLLKGTDFLRSLRNPPYVIFTTAYRDYALEGFELDAVDFLLKPVAFERFAQAMNKFFERSHIARIPSQAVQNGRTETGWLNVRSGRRTVRVDLEEIVYIEGMKDYVKIVTTGNELMSGMTLQELEKSLPADRFLRVHRSYITAINKIRAFTSEMIEIKDRQLPIGRYYKKGVLETLS